MTIAQLISHQVDGMPWLSLDRDRCFLGGWNDLLFL